MFIYWKSRGNAYGIGLPRELPSGDIRSVTRVRHEITTAKIGTPGAVALFVGWGIKPISAPLVS